MPFRNIDTNIDIEKIISIDIGIDIDIGKIGPIFLDFRGFFTGITYSLLKTNFVKLPYGFAKILSLLLNFYSSFSLGENIMENQSCIKLKVFK